MNSPETFQPQGPPSSKPDSIHPESRLTLNELSPQVKPLAINVSKQILEICKRNGIDVPVDTEETDTSLSIAVSNAVEKFIQKLSSDTSLMQDAKRLLELQQFLTSLHEQNKIPTNDKVLDGGLEEVLKKGVLYYQGDLPLWDLTSVEDLIFPRILEGTLYLNNLTSAVGLHLPIMISKSLALPSITSPEGLLLPEVVGETLALNALMSAKGLFFPKTIGQSLFLNSLTSPEGLHLPETIGEDLLLDGLLSVEGLIFPKIVGGEVHLESLPTQMKSAFRETHPFFTII